MVGPGGPTGLYNRPPAYSQNYLNNPLYGNGPVPSSPYYGGNGFGGNGFAGNGFGGYNPGYGGYPNPIAFNSKAGAGISADESTDEKQEQKKL